ncbi:MAG: 3'-5' exonuclease [Candidatus Dormibacteria bacterium]
MQTFCAFDLETTGFSGRGNEILQLAAVRLGPDGRVLDKLQMYVHPTSRIPVMVTRITGIRDTDVHWARPANEAVAIFKEFCAGDILVGHNAEAFDSTFIAAVDPTFKGRLIIDTLKVARRLIPGKGVGRKLTDLSARFGINHTQAHQAWSDAEATGVLFCHLVAMARNLKPTELAALADDPKAQSPSMQAFFRDIVPDRRRMPLNVPLASAKLDSGGSEGTSAAPATLQGTSAPVSLAGRTPKLQLYRRGGVELAGRSNGDSALGRTMETVRVQSVINDAAVPGHQAAAQGYSLAS